MRNLMIFTSPKGKIIELEIVIKNKIIMNNDKKKNND